MMNDTKFTYKGFTAAWELVTPNRAVWAASNEQIPRTISSDNFVIDELEIRIASAPDRGIVPDRDFVVAVLVEKAIKEYIDEEVLSYDRTRVNERASAARSRLIQEVQPDKGWFRKGD